MRWKEKVRLRCEERKKKERREWARQGVMKKEEKRTIGNSNDFE